METPHERRLHYEGNEDLSFSNINKIFKARVGGKNAKMRIAYAAGVRQPQKREAVYCVRIDCAQNCNALFKEEKVALIRREEFTERDTFAFHLLKYRF